MKKHVLCLGDSNTHGLCPDPNECEDRGNRYSENERWTCLLQKALGEDYLIIEEGLSGRTSSFPDPTREGMDTLPVLVPILLSHEPLDLLVLMLGTNDAKDHLNVNPTCIALGVERLIRKAKQTDCWGGKSPRILLIAPHPVGREMRDATMGDRCAEKTEHLAEEFSLIAAANGCSFLDAAEFSELTPVDHIHFSKKGHRMFAEKMIQVIPELLRQ